MTAVEFVIAEIRRTWRGARSAARPGLDSKIYGISRGTTFGDALAEAGEPCLDISALARRLPRRRPGRSHRPRRPHGVSARSSSTRWSLICKVRRIRAGPTNDTVLFARSIPWIWTRAWTISVRTPRGSAPRGALATTAATPVTGVEPGLLISSATTQHGGQETTLFSIITNLLHFGMVVVGLDYGHVGQMTLDEITGGSPYGATTIAGGDGSRLPTANELEGARYQGRKIAETAIKLHG